MFNGIVTVSSRNVVFDQRNVFVAGPGSGAMENAASTDARVIDSENTIVMSWSGGAGTETTGARPSSGPIAKSLPAFVSAHAAFRRISSPIPGAGASDMIVLPGSQVSALLLSL